MAGIAFGSPFCYDHPRLGGAIRKFRLKAKGATKESAARTIPVAWNANVRLIEAFNPNDCRNDFAATGYQPE
jgi:hypothetical protein